MSKRKSLVTTWLVDLLYFAVGSVLYGMSVNMFTAPNQIAPGGLTGLSTLINHVFGTPIGRCSHGRFWRSVISLS